MQTPCERAQFDPSSADFEPAAATLSAVLQAAIHGLTAQSIVPDFHCGPACLMIWRVEANISAPGHVPKAHVLPNRLMGDERLARDAGTGSERAFTTLFQRYHQQLYRYCRGLTGSDQDAQDALQMTFTKALIAMRQGRRNAPLRPWLYRIAHNESITLIRSRNASAGEVPLELAALQGVADSAEQHERMAMLVADLRELPEQQRGALVMRELSGLSHEEIAAALQLSVGAAKQSILEARRSLLEFAEGRAMTCEEIQRIISEDDRRSLRSRRVRAHVRDCRFCAAFAEAIPRRRADMLALWPVLPAASAAGLLAKITGAGTGHGGGGAGLAAGTAVKGLGATASIKAAAATGAAVLATATVGAVAVLHHGAPAASGSPSHGASVSNQRVSGSGHRSAAVHPAAGRHSSTANHRAKGKGHGPVAGKHTAGKGSHGKGTGSHGTGSHATGSHGSASPPNGHGSRLAVAPGQTKNHGHSAVRSATATHHGPAHSAHGKPLKVNPSVAKKSTNAKVGHGKLEPKPHRPAKVAHRPTKIVNTRTTRATTTGADVTKTTPVTRTSEAATSTTASTKATGAGNTKTSANANTTTAASGNATTGTSTVASTTTPPVATTTPPVATQTATTTISTPASSIDGGTGNAGTPPGQSAGSASGKNSK